LSYGPDVAAFRDGLEGAVLTPGGAGYEEARRIWNGVIDRRPAVIARCRGTADVAAAVGFARDNDLTVAVRGGGHNVAGMATVDGGLVVDLSALDAVRVDPDHRTVRVGGGAMLGGLDAATQAHGLAVPVGVVSETGIGGLSLSGGIGWLRRKHGLTCDNLLAAEVVTADGEVLAADAGQHAELLWALKGGGGNFGVVTSFEFACHPLGPEVAVAFALYPGARALEVLRQVDRYLAEAPDEVAPLAFFGRVPAAEPFPAEAHGTPYLAVLAPYAGDAEEGEQVLRPLRELGTPIVDLSDRMPYVDAQRLLDEDYPSGRRYYWKSIELAELSDDAIGQLMASAGQMRSELSTIDVWFQGGAMGRVAPEATAYGDRSAPILIGVEANWEDAATDEENIAWARRCVDDLRPFSEGGVYLNFPGFMEEREEMLRGAFGANYDRLVEVKTRYDPANVFRVNQNIPAATA
jgi:FAD/FMN-containing dehydrogenase